MREKIKCLWNPKKLLLNKKNVLVVFLRNKVCEKDKMQKKYPHKLARRIPKKTSQSEEKRWKNVLNLKKDNMECWYSADSWEKKNKAKNQTNYKKWEPNSKF